MRAAERKFGSAKKETRSAFLGRLKRTATSLSVVEIDDALGSMKRRCKDLLKTKGGQIEG